VRACSPASRELRGRRHDARSGTRSSTRAALSPQDSKWRVLCASPTHPPQKKKSKCVLPKKLPNKNNTSFLSFPTRCCESLCVPRRCHTQKRGVLQRDMTTVHASEHASTRARTDARLWCDDGGQTVLSHALSCRLCLTRPPNLPALQDSAARKQSNAVARSVRLSVCRYLIRYRYFRKSEVFAVAHHPFRRQSAHRTRH
jgi:hypothetical protein